MKNYDPVDIESIDKTEFWIVEDEEEPPLLDFDDMSWNKCFIKKVWLHKIRGNVMVYVMVGDDIDLGSFGDVNMDDRSNAQSGGVGTSNNENEDDEACLMEGLPRN
ncbi:hypothetical protein HYC85_013610 [Camellia sinensis]|uniref:Uncharacterized protein n=1 Tax=Camellia sinensis TaxID=4442 RepID=A0A7J7H3T7_CAMSI|nr:hypothetical protein HYC85_013610 [Camellia sinensis]